VNKTILAGLAEILEVPTVAADTVLAAVGQWDSMAVMQVIGLLDDKTGVIVEGTALAECVTAADVLRLAGLVVA
jgi:acyl carrier protein